MLLLAVAVLGLGLVPAAGAPAATAARAAVPDDCQLLIGPPGTAIDAAATSPAELLDGASPVRTGPCTGVRPGAPVRTPLGACSFNFVFRGWDPGLDDPQVRTFVGTAGHCVLSSNVGEQVWAQGQGPIARDGDNRPIGRFVYANRTNVRDFALVEVDPDVDVDPQMCHFGGPTGMETATGSGPVWLEQSGQGTLYGSTVPGRTHLARTFDNPDAVNFDGPVLMGDSGSGMVTAEEGKAVAVVVSITSNADGPMRATRIPPQLALASARTGLSFELVTAERM